MIGHFDMKYGMLGDSTISQIYFMDVHYDNLYMYIV